MNFQRDKSWHEDRISTAEIRNQTRVPRHSVQNSDATAAPAHDKTVSSILNVLSQVYFKFYMRMLCGYAETLGLNCDGSKTSMAGV